MNDKVVTLERVTAQRDALIAAIRRLVPDANRATGHGVEYGFSCGRGYLSVGGTVVAMEGDVCRDSNFGKQWTSDDFKAIERAFAEPLRDALVDTSAVDTGPGTPAVRFDLLTKELEKRFPSALRSNQLPEKHYINSIDEAIESAKVSPKQYEPNLDEVQDSEIIERFAKTIYMVEANSFEHLCLWAKHSSSSDEPLHLRYPAKRFDWRQENPGRMFYVGELGKDRPVCVSVRWDTLDGYWVCFYEMTSRFTDSEMVEVFLHNLYPYRYPNKHRYTDAMNFGHVIQHIEGLKKEGKKS